MVFDPAGEAGQQWRERATLRRAFFTADFRPGGPHSAGSQEFAGYVPHSFVPVHVPDLCHQEVMVDFVEELGGVHVRDAGDPPSEQNPAPPISSDVLFSGPEIRPMPCTPAHGEAAETGAPTRPRPNGAHQTGRFCFPNRSQNRGDFPLLQTHTPAPFRPGGPRPYSPEGTTSSGTGALLTEAPPGAASSTST